MNLRIWTRSDFKEAFAKASSSVHGWPVSVPGVSLDVFGHEMRFYLPMLCM